MGTKYFYGFFKSQPFLRFYTMHRHFKCSNDAALVETMGQQGEDGIEYTQGA